MLKKDIAVEVALGRMRILAELAESRTRKKTERDEKLAKRYVQIARAIGSRYKVGMPKELKNRICRNCSNLLVPGINCRVKMVSAHGYLAYMCECGKETHVFYKKAKKS